MHRAGVDRSRRSSVIGALLGLPMHWPGRMRLALGIVCGAGGARARRARHGRRRDVAIGLGGELFLAAGAAEIDRLAVDDEHVGRRRRHRHPADRVLVRCCQNVSPMHSIAPATRGAAGLSRKPLSKTQMDALAVVSRTVYIHSMSMTPPKGQRAISRDERPRPEDVAATPTKGRGTVWAIEHRYARPDRRELRRRLGHAGPAGERGAPRPRDHGHRGARQIDPRQERFARHLASICSVNPYRGCEHGCIYCFARPTHSYLGLSPGLDFETKIIAKVNAAELLRDELAARATGRSRSTSASATDAYQPIERKLGITRAVIEVLAECAHPFSLVTKSSARRARPRPRRADGRATGSPRSTSR